MKYIISLFVWLLRLNLLNFQTKKNSIFKIIKYQNYFTLRLSSDSNKISYKKLFQSVKTCLATCSFEEPCNLVQLNKSEKSCSFYTAVDGNSIQTITDYNSIIYRKKGYIFYKGLSSYKKTRKFDSLHFFLNIDKENETKLIK